MLGINAIYQKWHNKYNILLANCVGTFHIYTLVSNINTTNFMRRKTSKSYINHNFCKIYYCFKIYMLNISEFTDGFGEFTWFIFSYKDTQKHSWPAVPWLFTLLFCKVLRRGDTTRHPQHQTIELRVCFHWVKALLTNRIVPDYFCSILC